MFKCSAIIFLLIAAYVVEVVHGQRPIIQSVLNYYRELFQLPRGTVKDVTTVKNTYDFIVIGAGSGGSVVTNRLTENKDWSVLLIEAGKEEILLTDVPLLSSYILGTDYNWGYKAEPQDNACLSMNGRKCSWPRGKSMGGTSVINFMVYTRGFKPDYDLWASLGNDGWSYGEVFKYFMKSENIEVPSLKKSRYHSYGGYLNIERPKWRSPLVGSFLEMGKNLGYPAGDTDGLTPHGFYHVLTNTKDGARQSASKAFLRPIRNRANLHVTKRSKVTKILIDPATKKAFGVEYVKNNKKYSVRARKEVILSAGSLNTPQLLMLSGVGRKDHLNEMGIPVIQNLKVGDNLQDHISMAGLAFLVNDTVSIIESRFTSARYILDYWVRGEGPYTLPGGAEAVAFVSTKYNDNRAHPDMELVFGPGAFTGDTGGSLRSCFNMNDTFYRQVYKPYEEHDAFNVVPVLLRPRSRGAVRLRSANPFHWPLLYPNYYTDERDLHTMVEGIKMAVAVGTGKSFKKWDSRLLPTKFPGCEQHTFATDAYWACAARHLTTNLHHQTNQQNMEPLTVEALFEMEQQNVEDEYVTYTELVGTCKMGPPSDPNAVVDPRLRVYGIKNLRIVDASIMPVIPASHTNAVVVMIGEKAADLIKEDWKDQ